MKLLKFEWCFIDMRIAVILLFMGGFWCVVNSNNNMVAAFDFDWRLKLLGYFVWWVAVVQLYFICDILFCLVVTVKREIVLKCYWCWCSDCSLDCLHIALNYHLIDVKHVHLIFSGQPQLSSGTLAFTGWLFPYVDPASNYGFHGPHDPRGAELWLHGGISWSMSVSPENEPGQQPASVRRFVPQRR